MGTPLKVAGSPNDLWSRWVFWRIGFVLDSNPMAGKGRKLSYFDVPGTALSWDPAMATKLGSISMSCGDSVWNCSSFLNVSEISAIFIFSSGSWTLWGSFRFHRFVSSLLHMLRQRMRRLGTHLFWYDLIRLWGIDIGLIYEMPCQYHHVV